MESHSSTPNRTPISSRPYLNVNNAVHHQTPVNNSLDSMNSRMMQEHSEFSTPNRGVIYGTTIETSEVSNNLERFILDYELNKEHIIGDQKQMIPEKIYYEDFKSLFYDEERTIFNVSGSHLMEFDREMYYQFIYFPA